MTDFHVVQDGKRYHVIMGLGRWRRKLTTRGYRTRERAQVRANHEAAAYNARQRHVVAELLRIEALIKDQH